jgi:hypothetical protein
MTFWPRIRKILSAIVFMETGIFNHNTAAFISPDAVGPLCANLTGGHCRQLLSFMRSRDISAFRGFQACFGDL